MTKWQKVKRIGGDGGKPRRPEAGKDSESADWMEALLLESSEELGESGRAQDGEDIASALLQERDGMEGSEPEHGKRKAAGLEASRGQEDEDWASLLLLAEEDGGENHPSSRGAAAGDAASGRSKAGGHGRNDKTGHASVREGAAPFNKAASTEQEQEKEPSGKNAAFAEQEDGRPRKDGVNSGQEDGRPRKDGVNNGQEDGRPRKDGVNSGQEDGQPRKDAEQSCKDDTAADKVGDAASKGKADPSDGSKQSGDKQAGSNAAPGTNGDMLEPIPDDIGVFVERLKKEVGYKTSFDVIVRQMTLGGRKTAFFMLNGLSSGQLMTEILERLTFLQSDAITTGALESFMNLYVPAVQVEQEKDWNMMMTGVLSGSTGMYIDGESTMLILDTKMFPMRGPEEPSLERVVRGSRDGFVETMLMNVSLVRRRLRDPMLRLENLRVGERTRSDVCIAYIDDIADKELVESIRDKISAVKLDGIPLADKQLEEATVKRGWNPYPLVRYSERPDVVASHLLEGSVAVFVDTSPSVMILPTTFFDLVQHAEENRQTPFIGTYLRWLRFFGIIASLILVPIWLLFAMNPHLLPPDLAFIGPAKTGKLPLFVQFLLAEAGIDLMRMAAIHTPTPLAMAISLVSAILVGDIAVQTGLFVNEVILYMAIAAIGMFATPSYELSLANRIVRLLLICLVAAFHIPGLVLGWTVVFIMLTMQRSFNRPYMWPFIPFDPKGMLNIILRMPVMENRKRPNLLRPQQRDKMPETEKE